MKFKVGDIVRFTGCQFKEFMLDKEHIVTRVGEDYIMTKGRGWNYMDHGSKHEELYTNKNHWVHIETVNTNFIHKNKLNFNFITEPSNLTSPGNLTTKPIKLYHLYHVD